MDHTTQTQHTLPIIKLGHTHYRRCDMPQIDDDKAFIAYLTAHRIHHKLEPLSPQHLKATQNELNLELVFKIIESGLDTHNRPVIISRDHHILDGHNRVECGLILRVPVWCI